MQLVSLQKDSLMEITFHVPNSNAQFVGDEARPSAQVSFSNFFYSSILEVSYFLTQLQGMLDFIIGILC